MKCILINKMLIFGDLVTIERQILIEIVERLYFHLVSAKFMLSRIQSCSEVTFKV